MINDEKLASRASYQANYQELFYKTTDVVLLVNPNSLCIEEVNPACEYLFGVPEKELQGRKITELVEKNEEVAFTKFLRVSRNRYYPRRKHFTFSLKEDNKLAPVLLEIVVCALELNNQTSILQIVGKDVTKDLEEQKNLVHIEKLNSLGMLASGIAQEINNPLAIVNGYVEYLQESLKEEGMVSAQYTGSMNKIIEAVKRITNMMQGLRMLAKAENSIQEAFSLELSIDQIVRLVSPIYSNDGIQVVVNTDTLAKDLLIMGVKSKFQQAVMNLLSNAREAVKGRDKKLINIEISKAGNICVLKVMDTGYGIDSRKLGQIFDSLYSTKEIVSGVGLGLWIVHQIITRMNGEIKATSEPDVGSTFTIYLPIHQVTNSFQKKNDLSSIETSQLFGKYVLVVEDEEAIRFLMIRHLTKVGMIVEEASDGYMALEKLKDRRFDYIITDLKMPHLDGSSLIARLEVLLQPIQPAYRPKVFVVSGNLDISDLKDSSLIAGVLKKPFSKDELYHMLESCVG